MKEYKTKSFSAYNVDNIIRLKSSSGGVFFALAKKTLDNSGVVYGAAFDKDWQVKHKRCTNIECLYELMQSKYVQSSVGESFKEIAEDLQDTKLVLFCGTPCQVMGLKRYLKSSIKDQNVLDNLMTVDFICHGVPSRMVWRKYLEKISNNKVIERINFRYKEERSWDKFNLYIEFKDNSIYCKPFEEEPYMIGFLENLYLRPSCHKCYFKGIDRESDITLADFWGVKKVNSELYDPKGLSVIMVHNNIALNYINEMYREGMIEIKPINNEIISKYNAFVEVSGIPAKNRKRYFKMKHYNYGSRYIISDIYGFSLRRTQIWNFLRKVKKAFYEKEDNEFEK